MKVVSLSLSVDVDASAQEVFDYFAHWSRQNEWMLGTTVSVVNPEFDKNGHAVGSLINGFTGVGPLGFNDLMRITVFEHPHRVDVIHLGKIVRGTGTMKVISQSPTSSTFVWAEDVEIPGGAIGYFGFMIIKPFFLWAINFSLKKFAKKFAS